MAMESLTPQSASFSFNLLSAAVEFVQVVQEVNNQIYCCPLNGGDEIFITESKKPRAVVEFVQFVQDISNKNEFCPFIGGNENFITKSKKPRQGGREGTAGRMKELRRNQSRDAASGEGGTPILM